MKVTRSNQRQFIQKRTVRGSSVFQRRGQQILPTLPYRPEQFGLYLGAPLTQPADIDFTWEEACRCAITVGRRNWYDVLQYGGYSALEASWRIAILYANLVEEPDGRLKPSDSFNGLDRTEKGAISYFLGTCFTKLILEKLFGVPWLLHLDVYRASLNPGLAFTTRPDFVGLDALQQWAVVEAKGRSWDMPNPTMSAAKAQTRSLRHINGQLPALRTVVGIHFSRGRLTARVWDPDEYDQEAEDFEIDPDRFLRIYYRPLVEYLRRTSSVQQARGQTPVRTAELTDLDATLSINDDIWTGYETDARLWHTVVEPKATREDSVLAELATLKRSPEEQMERGGGERLQRLIDKRRSSNIATAIDGVAVTLGTSWSPEKMRRQPQARANQ